jgi:hypothetical protein
VKEVAYPPPVGLPQRVASAISFMYIYEYNLIIFILLVVGYSERHSKISLQMGKHRLHT